MKKLMLSLIAILGFSMMVSAQEAATKTVKKVETKTKVKTEAKAADAKTKTTTESKVVLKKDGTPDKRYKKTKTVVTKKDGTPDMRYKENKK